MPIARFPVDPLSLTASWLTEVLRGSGAIRSAGVVSFQGEPMSTERGLTAQLVRVRLSYDRAEAGAPASVVAKFSDVDPQYRAILHAMGFYRREVFFYRQLAATTPVTTPRCYYADLDPEQGTSVIVLEDLGTARGGSWVMESSLEDISVAVTAIADVHARWWQDDLLRDEQVLPLTGFLAVDQVGAVFDRAWPPFLSRLTAPASDQVLQAGALLAEHLQTAHERLYGSPPRTLVHNDYDGDNLFYSVGPDGPLVTVVDWQMTTAGRAPIDLAWLIAGQCEPSVRRRIEKPLLSEYHALLVERGVTGYSLQEIWDDYRLALLLPAGRTVSAVGLGARAGGPGGFWDVVVPRYAQAIVDLEVQELVRTL